ncbi:hypothetical protein NQ318_005210 [Aromia moschata]|uniref:Uncharacterized protein n=1 Tax=Aromia moschata TaxID=1265417 RepID=A0AAV8XJE2_9CUCU|nr:hypothetical protein NQ318_005210 [Aromia moschata]
MCGFNETAARSTTADKTSILFSCRPPCIPTPLTDPPRCPGTHVCAVVRRSSHAGTLDSEMRYMICNFAQANNGHEAARRYLQVLPKKKQPNHKLCRNLYNHLGETGSFPSKSNYGTPKTITVDEDGILIRVSKNPGVSSHRALYGERAVYMIQIETIVVRGYPALYTPIEGSRIYQKPPAREMEPPRRLVTFLGVLRRHRLSAALVSRRQNRQGRTGPAFLLGHQIEEGPLFLLLGHLDLKDSSKLWSSKRLLEGKCNPSGHSEICCYTVGKTEVSRSLEQVTWFFSRYTVASFLVVVMKQHEFLERALAVWWTDVSNSGFSLFVIASGERG